MAAVADETKTSSELVAGRYRVQARLATGGMGAVYRAFDQLQKREVALKRLSGEGDLPRRTRMFEREFHTLMGLKHPRIIEVFDYGIDERGPYYTMELLDGRDLREVTPLPYPLACSYLRDVASSLALLHARGLLHRDLSARNVRITSSGHAKLIDFGALADFGRNRTLVGTAPLVPPEAFYRGELDQRADLYALGALAYWALTGRHARDARELDELPAMWLRPLAPPSCALPSTAGLPAIPAELDQLVVALLSRNPLARPASAAEVIARLSTIAKLAPDEEPLSLMSYLRGGQPVGRIRERRRLRRRLKLALGGRGSLVQVEAEGGMGVGRIFFDLAIEARLWGATAVVVDAGMHRGAYAVVEELVRGLLAAQPEQTRSAARGHEAELSRLFATDDAGSVQRRAMSPAETGAADPRETRMRAQTALLACFEQLAKHLPLMFAIHNFERADDNSAAFLAALARGIQKRRMMIVLGCNTDEPAPASAAHASLRQSAVQLRLRGLERDDVRALVESSFGSAQNSERLAAWLHQLTAGKPQACLDLMQHLVEQGVIRFNEGVWCLPQELSAHDLPVDLGHALDARIDRLSEDARKLACAIGVHRGPMPLSRCLALAEREGVVDARRMLSELEQRGVIATGDDSVHFSHVALREAVLRRLDDTTRKGLHALLGALLATEGKGDPSAVLDAGWHLLHGGEERRGADMLAEAGVALSFDADGLPAALPALRAALHAFRKQGRGQHELARVLAALATGGFFADRRAIEEHGDEAALSMHRVLGLALAKRLSPWCGTWLATRIGLGFGLLRLVLVRGPTRGVASFTQLVQLFVPLALSLTGHGTMTLDGPRARRYASLLEPLCALGPEHAASIMYRLTDVLSTLCEDRIAQTLLGLRSLKARLEDPRPIVDMPDDSRRFVLGTVLYALGVLEAFRESPEVLAIADTLESMGVKLFELFANQLRTHYHGLRGEVGLCEVYRQRVEVFAIQAGSGWQAEIWAPTTEISVHHRTGDIVGIRRVMGQLERLVKEVPSLHTQAQIANATYASMRGDHLASREILQTVLDSAEPRGFSGWIATVGAQMHNLIALGDAHQARIIGLRTLGILDAEDRSVSIMVTPIIVHLALAEAALGDLQPAAARIESYLAELGGRAGATTRGILHEARTRIAQQARDGLAARQHLAAVERCFAGSDNPVLIARFERLKHAIERADSRALEAQAETRAPEQVSLERLIRVLADCDGSRQRYDRVLQLLLDQTGATSGYLFSYADGELHLVAPHDATPPATKLRESVQRAIAIWCDAQHDDKTELSTTVDSLLSTWVAPEQRYCTYLIEHQSEGAVRVIAAAAVAVGSEPLRAPSPTLLSALAGVLTQPSAPTTQRAFSRSSLS